MSQPSKLVLGYCRVSSAQQVNDGESLERQEQQIINYCLLKELPAPAIIRDEGISGFKATRPGYQRIIDLCRSGQVSTLIVYDLSRLSRSVRHTLEFIDDVITKHGVTFVSLKQDINTESATGRAFLTIASVFNQLYRDEISEKTRAALAHKKANGEKGSGYVPFGFNVREKKLLLNPKEQSAIALMVALKNRGYSYHEIIEVLLEKGIPTKLGKVKWTPGTIHKILSRPELHQRCQKTA